MSERYFFCGIGGSGMLPLAMIVKAGGAQVSGSDRALDQGRGDAKFDWLRDQGITLYPQDGRGLEDPAQIVVASAAIEPTVPDMAAAIRLGCRRLTRAELLARLFNAGAASVAVGGTSGKSTVTAMTGWILTQAGLDPTIMNGAVMANFADAQSPYAAARIGGGQAFVSEVDESDGSIALYRPQVAVVTNIALDHKPLNELRDLFGDFVGHAGIAILNADDSETQALATRVETGRVMLFGFGPMADVRGDGLEERADGIRFLVSSGHSQPIRLDLPVPGRHNAANALAALAAARALGVPIAHGVAALARFAGIRRRLEVLGVADGVTVIDDFGHNPDKIRASLSTLAAFDGRLLVLFQPHGYGPLKLMGPEIAHAFAACLRPHDQLVITDPAYFGGTTDRSVGSAEVVDQAVAAGADAHYIADRAVAIDRFLAQARAGDRIVIMGARDDSLSVLGHDLVARLARRAHAASAGL